MVNLRLRLGATGSKSHGWVIRGRGAAGTQVTCHSRSLKCPFQYDPHLPLSTFSVFDKPEKALLLTSGRKASQKEQLACSLYFLLRIFVSTVSQKIFLLPLENIIYKVEAITQEWSVLVFFASPRRINSPLTRSLAIAVLELAFALFTGLNNADVVI